MMKKRCSCRQKTSNKLKHCNSIGDIIKFISFIRQEYGNKLYRREKEEKRNREMEI